MLQVSSFRFQECRPESPARARLSRPNFQFLRSDGDQGHWPWGMIAYKVTQRLETQGIDQSGQFVEGSRPAIDILVRRNGRGAGAGGFALL